MPSGPRKTNGNESSRLGEGQQAVVESRPHALPGSGCDPAEPGTARHTWNVR